MPLPDLRTLLPALDVGLPAVLEVARGNVGPITVRTSLTPPLTLDPMAGGAGGADGPGGGWGGALVKLLKPTVEVQLKDGRTVTYAPAGVPRENHLPLLGAGLGLGLLAVFGLGGLVGNVLGGRGTLAALGAGVVLLGAVARSGEAPGSEEEAS